jgi:hypothetical protein
MTNNVPQETINSVLVDILKGANDASSEIYGASKTGIVKAVDFAQEQAPLVVQEFLTWKFAQSVIYVIIALISIGVLAWIFAQSRKWASENNDGSEIFGWFGMSISLFASVAVVFSVLVPNVEQMVKVKVAPRVFIIEWVSDQVNPPKHHNR